ncbi:MAG TPA: CHAD domain-containing protein [Roseiflexaceae bacterium]|nr:CHAD domain-containing protein [Roseiflexaceae bacterium]
MTQTIATDGPGAGTPGGEYLRALALALFDGAVEAHGLPIEARRLLQIAADYYSAVRGRGDDHPDRFGRDLVLLEPIAGLSPEQQSVVASVVAFQRDKLRRTREPAFLRLDPDDQQLALQLAAVLHLATALEGRGTDEFWINSDKSGHTLLIGGTNADDAARLATARAERWHRAIGDLAVRCVTPADSVTTIEPLADIAPDDTRARVAAAFAMGTPARLLGDELLPEAARRMLRRQFERMLAREDDVRSGEDPEDVHQMRVATRRLRASLQIVQPIYNEKAIVRFRRGLRRIARTLGAVRDRDVFLGHVVAYRDSLPDEQRAAVAPLIDAVERQRTGARADLLDTLRSGRYTKFKHAFAEFLTTPGAGLGPLPETGVPPRVRDRAGSLLWQRYEDWRAFEVLLPDAPEEVLHNARIAGKRLRYTIEFFADAFGPRADELLAPLMQLQENLGAIQDAAVAREHVAELDMEADPGARIYLAAREHESNGHLADLPRLWEKVASATYRRKLFEAISRL